MVLAPRPWGWYRVLTAIGSFKVKLLSVDPGQRLSLQRHQHRSEVWLVLRGAGQITCDDQRTPCGAGHVARIPAGAVHRLVCSSAVPLLVLEVQRGDYLGEDDIERLADDYGRGNAPGLSVTTG